MSQGAGKRLTHLHWPTSTGVKLQGVFSIQTGNPIDGQDFLANQVETKYPIRQSTMCEFLSWLIFITIFAIFGALISLLVLLPPIRSFGRHNRETRFMVSAGLGLFSFAASFGFWANASAKGDVLAHLMGLEMIQKMGELPDPEVNRWFLSPDFEMNRPAITSELWRRKLVPPPLRQSCYTPEATVCYRVGLIPDTGGWSEYLSALGLGLGAALTSFGLSQRITQPKHLMTRPDINERGEGL